MHELEMREVQQVVDQPAVVRLEMEIARRRDPVGIVKPVVVGNQALIRERRIAHPDPDPAPALDHRIGPHRRARRNRRLPGDRNAAAGAVEGEAVIAALQPVVYDAAHRQGQRAMAAAIFQRDGGTIGAAIEHDWLVEDGARNRRVLDVGAPRRDIPLIAQEHPAGPVQPSLFLDFLFFYADRPVPSSIRAAGARGAPSSRTAVPPSPWCGGAAGAPCRGTACARGWCTGCPTSPDRPAAIGGHRPATGPRHSRTGC